MKPITPEQLRKLWTAARGAGFDKDAVHGMLPQGKFSTRDLDIREACILIDAIESGKSPNYENRKPFERHSKPRRSQGNYRLATDAQRNTIRDLADELDWTWAALADWLSKRKLKDGRPMSVILESGAAISSSDMIHVIELLKHVLERKQYFKETREAREHRAPF